jgi:hypothetical protein
MSRLDGHQELPPAEPNRSVGTRLWRCPACTRSRLASSTKPAAHIIVEQHTFEPSPGRAPMPKPPTHLEKDARSGRDQQERRHLAATHRADRDLRRLPGWRSDRVPPRGRTCPVRSAGRRDASRTGCPSPLHPFLGCGATLPRSGRDTIHRLASEGNVIWSLSRRRRLTRSGGPTKPLASP